MNVSAIIPAAGAGSRFGSKKQLKILGNRPLLFHTLQPFIDSDLINEIIVPVPKADVAKIDGELQSLISSKPVKVIAGGTSRQDSVSLGLKAADKKADLICIHDAVRPFVTTDMISKAVEACHHHDAVILAIPARDTIKEVAGDQIISTLSRDSIWLAQTPQIFRRSVLLDALEQAKKEEIQGTDEAALVERLGYQVGIIEGSPLNIKITTKEDWLFAEAIFADKGGGE